VHVGTRIGVVDMTGTGHDDSVFTVGAGTNDAGVTCPQFNAEKAPVVGDVWLGKLSYTDLCSEQHEYTLKPTVFVRREADYVVFVLAC
jgi:hypothetical protein